ncbi:cytidine deaminase [Ketogulonicigenium vulgare]|uniref:cytidine deaminase n=1 Tax=Ketogulonicigenium vulgare TaxID=92945 RepID=UPI0023581E0A|nr:cytidine deaminase [Ketogulonicigenium vulgare]
MFATRIPANPDVPARLLQLSDRQDAIRADALSPLADPAYLRREGRRITADHADSVIARYGLSGVEELMLLLLPDAEKVATPPISGFHVGTVGRAAGSGALTLGGNIEFPGAHLGQAIHGEGFVTTRAFLRGESLSHIALTAAHPCGHCRQFLTEFESAPDLRLIDPRGGTYVMDDLLPFPFNPAALETAGAVPGHVAHDLALADGPARDLLIHAGNRAHVPYSHCPSALVLELRDGTQVWGTSIESCAYNPTIMPAQAALIMLLDHGYSYGDIARAWFARPKGAVVDLARASADLLAAVAPDASLTILEWN